MTIEKRTADAVQREFSQRTPDRIQHLNEANDRFERLVKIGAVQPERYNLAPISPISYNSGFVIS
ncbi:hypothetical protein [Pseudomonas cichorii]|uniref:hypothetical protein n=1 Tax=Pseudomonas cichorii TaxID=36746 RepID=UPI001C89EB1B|nr:hypothetical protein [Pseudomonas cichorii]MBX8487703.1 hypothetical protein [Pseudomonas cichorii]